MKIDTGQHEKLILGRIKIDTGQYENGDWVPFSGRAEGEKVDRVE
jgi:hypothetical protein